MRGIEDTRQRWKTLFQDNRNTSEDLRKVLKSEQGDDICNEGLRSICWKAFLLFGDLDRAQWPQKISESRSAYVALKTHFLKYIEHPDDLQSTVDPLADDEESPWQVLRNDEQTRADISQDVDRCLQENFFFREPATKAKMIDILFIYSKLNPDLGYRQGMHEILAPILWVIDRDAIEPKSLKDISSAVQDDDVVLQLLDHEYIEHDAFTLFCAVMQNIRVYYEHNRHQSANGQIDVIPIVHQCQHIHNNLLAATDPELADHLQALEILPQIFLTRWMRLLFGREFPFQDVLIIWDLLFAEGLRSELIDFACIAMLLRVRWQLLNADSSGVLSMLLRYPSPHPHAPLSFVHDGLYLEQNPTSERGAFLISKYSGKPPDTPKLLDPLSGKHRSVRIFQYNLRDRSEASSPSRSPARNSPLNFEALFQDVSEGIQKRTESWGVAKAVRGAVSEAKKNMQAIQSEHSSRVIRHWPPSANYPPEVPIPQELNAITQLKARIQGLEEMNKLLAKSLSQAVNDIRSHMISDKDADASTTDVIKEALQKIQSVQTCLENSSTPSNAEHQAPKSDNNVKGASHDDPICPEEKPKVAETSASETLGHSGSSNSPNPTLAENEKAKRSTSSSIQKPFPMPLRHAMRPSLADSEFSWMLGRDRHLSSFVSPASVPPEQTRHGEMRIKPNALFGNADDEQKRPSTDSDGMALRSLRGPKGGE